MDNHQASANGGELTDCQSQTDQKEDISQRQHGRVKKEYHSQKKKDAAQGQKAGAYFRIVADHRCVYCAV